MVNDAAGAEDMVEKLTEQNLDLNEVSIILLKIYIYIYIRQINT